MTPLILATSLLAISSPVQSEECQLLLDSSQSVPIDLVLEDPAELSLLPDNATAVACPRTSLIPTRNDVRVLTEWGVAFGIIEDGPRSLWIWMEDGRLQVTVDGGDLSSTEAAAVSEWLESSQTQVDATLVGP